MKNKFKYKLKAFRLYKKMSQVKFSTLVEMDQSMISKFELGASDPRLSTITKIAEKCDLRIDWLTGRDYANSDYERAIDEIAAMLERGMNE